MSNNRTPLKAWVRYDYNKMAIPGSIIYRRTKPGGNYSHYRELIVPDPNPCCPVPTITCADYGYWGEVTNNYPFNTIYNSEGSVVAANVVVDGCYSYKLSGLPDYYYSSDITTDSPYQVISRHILVEKVGPNGNVEWKKIFYYGDTQSFGSYSYSTYAENISMGVDGNLYITTDYMIFKIDKEGNLIWSQSIDCLDENCTNYFDGCKMLHTSDGRVYLVGQESIRNVDLNQYYHYTRITEIDPETGLELPNKHKSFAITSMGFGLNTSYGGYNHIVDNDDNIILSVNNYNGSGGLYLNGLVKIDRDLNVIWSVQFVGNSPGFISEVTGIAADANNDLYVTFFGNSSVMKLSGTNGSAQWSKAINWSYGESGGGIYTVNTGVDSQGDVYVFCQNSASPLSPGTPVLVICKYKPNGTFVDAYPSPYPSQIWNTATTGNGLWFTGWSSQAVEIKDDIVYMNAGSFDAYIRNNLYKLPLTNLGDGAAGSYLWNNDLSYSGGVDDGNTTSSTPFIINVGPAFNQYPIVTFSADISGLVDANTTAFTTII